MAALDLEITRRITRRMRGEVVRGQDILGVDLATADLRDARFEEVLFSSCNLAGADLRGAQFILCTMRSIVLRDIVLGDNLFYGTTFVEPSGLADDARRVIERCGGVFMPPDGCRGPQRTG